MKSVTYRTSTILNRIILTGGFVLVGILLILAGLNEGEAISNRIYFILAGIVGIPYFGRYFILYMILLLRDKTIVSYDDYIIKVKNRQFSLHEVQKVSMTSSFPVGFLWIHTPAYMILTFTGEKVYIPTYYAMNKKDEGEVYDILKHVISNKKKAEKGVCPRVSQKVKKSVGIGMFASVKNFDRKELAMKTVKTKSGHTTQEEMQKKFRFVTVAFCIISLFISLINIQSITILPSWLNISLIILLICSIALFGYGLFFSRKYISWVKGGLHFFFFLLVISFQLLLTSNGMYTIGVREGQIVEEVNFSQLTLLLYLASAVILLVLSLFISSPKLRRMDGYKAYVTGTILAVVMIAIIFIALNVIRGTFFTHPDKVKESYEFFIGSVLALFPATALGVSIIRVKKHGIE